ncbi:DUF2809 domain-containing protein [Niabella yanshanensis]|uniref:DUF2809 domain-containing protein n=1 Tax=Niabella yanshanensis TaxID=577386 RepID=A0ABZ0WA37_9BACT|nr:DUF2809 domain-containing protein [Niabella yanshanensis]WQD40160.1 DUF2809 domain-containing protein [Niabella yanshanensis]
MLIFRKKYFFSFVLLFVVEVLIALYIHDNFVRPYIGDVFVVILIYCFVKSFIKLPVLPAATGVLVFSFIIETLQYFNIVDRLGLGHSKLARTVIGTSFAWEDIGAYVAGFIIILLAERSGSIKTKDR